MLELPLFSQWVFQQEYLIKIDVMRRIFIFLRCVEPICCKCDKLSIYSITVLEPLGELESPDPLGDGVAHNV